MHQKLIYISILTCCRVHRPCWLYRSSPYIHTQCCSLVYLCTIKIILLRLNWGKAGWATEWINKRLVLVKYNLIYWQILLTSLFLLFITAALCTFATIVFFWEDGNFVITVRTATNSVFFFLTWWFHYFIVNFWRKVKRREKVNKANHHLTNTCMSKRWNWFWKKVTSLYLCSFCNVCSWGRSLSGPCIVCQGNVSSYFSDPQYDTVL